MSASNEWTDWHLTPRGWERGSQKCDNQPEVTKPVPVDRVLTSRFTEEVSGLGGRADRYGETTWRHEQETKIIELLAKYGECPEKL